MGKKPLLFLGGLGAPVAVFAPWFAVLRWFGYDIHRVPNSFFTCDPVSRFAANLVEASSRFERVDVLGVSYGGNAAVYAACLSPEFSARVGRMVAVCAPLLGTPGLLDPVMRLVPRSFARTLEEMARDSPVVNRIRELGSAGPIPFELHCLYHDRDTMAPMERATLPKVSTNHRLDFAWKAVPGLAMHQAACINPKTLDTVIQILLGPAKSAPTSAKKPEGHGQGT